MCSVIYRSDFQTANNAKVHIRTANKEKVHIRKVGNDWGAEYTLMAGENFKVAIISKDGEVICQFWAIKTCEQVNLF